MGFILDGLGSEPYDRNYTDGELVRRILVHFRPHARRMLLLACTIALRAIASTGGSILIARGIDALAANPSTKMMLLVTVSMLLLGGFTWASNYVRHIFSARVVGDVVLDLRRTVFEATMGHDLSFFDAQPSGKIVSRITSDTQGFARAVTLTMSWSAMYC